MWLEHINCLGNETELTDCSVDYAVNPICTEVGVSCLPFSEYAGTREAGRGGTLLVVPFGKMGGGGGGGGHH